MTFLFKIPLHNYPENKDSAIFVLSSENLIHFINCFIWHTRAMWILSGGFQINARDTESGKGSIKDMFRIKKNHLFQHKEHAQRLVLELVAQLESKVTQFILKG